MTESGRLASPITFGRLPKLQAIRPGVVSFPGLVYGPGVKFFRPPVAAPGLLAGAAGFAALVIWRVSASKRERARLEALVASRTRQLRQSEALFRSIFEHATEGIFQSSLDGRNLRANPAMARLCGYASPEEMRALLTDAATLFYVRPGRRAEINARKSRGKAWSSTCESEIRRRDGGTIWIAESVQAR